MEIDRPVTFLSRLPIQNIVKLLSKSVKQLCPLRIIRHDRLPPDKDDLERLWLALACSNIACNGPWEDMLILLFHMWTMEHLCRWYGEQIARGSPPKEKGVNRREARDRSDWQSRTEVTRVVLVDRESKTQLIQRASEDTHRTHLEWLLARIGKKVGCRVWIAGDDHHRVWQQERLGDMSLETLSLVTNLHRHQALSHIDVLWFQKNELVAAYKIARTPEEIALCVVASGAEIEHVQGELSRPTFQKHSMRKQCGFLVRELLFQHEEHILRWATGLSVIEDLLTYIGLGA